MPPLNRIEQTYRRLISEGRPIVKLFSGNPNDHGFHFPAEVLERVYRDYFRRQDYKPHPRGLLRAREAIAGYYKERGVELDPEGILLTSGTSESFFYLFSLLARPGDNILTPNPAYPLFDQIAKLSGVELRPYRLDEDRGWAVDVEDLRKKTDDRTKAIVLVSPNNPTGAVVDRDQIREIVDWANHREIPMICDEVFSEFHFGEGDFPRPMVLSKPGLCFTLNGISKMFALPAMKLSWIAVTGERRLVDSAVDRLETTADTFLSCHIPIQEALPEIFSQGRDFLRSYREEVRKRRDLAVSLLRQSHHVRFTEPAGGFYLMAEVLPKGTRHLSEEEFVIRLMEERGVFVHPGYFYDYERGIHFVISFLAKPAVLRAGLNTIVSATHSP